MRAYGVMVSAVLTAFWCSDANAQAGGQPPQPQPTPAPPTSAYPAPAPQPSPAPPAPPPYAPGAQPGAPPAATQPGYPQDPQGAPPQGAPPPAYPQPGYAPPQPGYAAPQAGPTYSTYDEPLSDEAEREPPWRANQPGVVLGAERLTGFYYWNLEPESGSGLSGTTFNLLFTRDGGYANVGVSGPSPRLSLDGVLGPGVTVGGTIGFSSNNVDLGGEEVTFSALVLNPRVGYIASPNETISLWPRLGISYSIQWISDSNTDVSLRILALAIDPMLVIHPMPHIGILLGPVFEVSLSGTVESDTSTASNDFSTLTAGLAAGVAIFF